MDRQFSKSGLEHDLSKDECHEESPWTKQKIFVLLIMLYANFCTATCWSLPAPFFPLEAELKGATPTIYGFVFGAFQLTACIFAPILAKLMPILQVKFLLNSGIFVAGTCSILFGILEWCPPGVPFITLAFIVRIVEAIGVTAYFTSVYGLIPVLFPDKIATVLSLMETVFGIGSIIGPTVGGALYQVGGFFLPFVTMGLLLLTGALATYISFPNQYSKPNEEPAEVKKMLLNTTYLVDMSIYCMCFLCLGFNEATLEPHIREFNLQPAVLGLIFVISGTIYAVSAPLWGYLTDKNIDSQLLCIMGCFSCVICYLIIGPAPFLGFKATIPVVIVSQIFLGIGVGSKLICSYMHAMKDLLNRGFTDSVATYGLFSGLASVFSSGGSFIGPSMGGALMENLGYANATMFVVGLESIVIFVAMTFWIRRKFPAVEKKDGEKTPLLDSKTASLQNSSA